MDQYQCRWSTRNDRPAILAIEAGTADPWTEEELRTAMMRANVIGNVAVDDEGIIVGHVVFELNRDHIRILRLAVHSAERFRGVGRAMVAKVASKLSRHKRKRAAIVVPDTDLGTHKFLASCGFQATQVLPGFFPGTGRDGYSFSLFHSIAAVTLPAGAIA